MAIIRQEINISDVILNAPNATVVEASAVVQLDTTQYNGTVTYYFEVIGKRATTATARLRRKGTGTGTVKLQEDNGSFGSWADKVTIVSAGTAATATRVRSASFTPVSGRNYRIVTQNSSSMGSLSIYNAKIIVDQTGVIIDQYPS